MIHAASFGALARIPCISSIYSMAFSNCSLGVGRYGENDDVLSADEERAKAKKQVSVADNLNGMISGNGV